MIPVESLERTVSNLLPEVQQFLCELLRFESTSGNEQRAMEFLYERFKKLNVAVEKINLSDSIKSDPDYSSPIPDIKYAGRFNLRICRKGRGAGKRLLLNTHVDVVPPSEGMVEPWTGRVEDGIVFGRGACDAKGQVAAVYMLFRLLQQLDVHLAGDLIAHLVVEEENGGNGTLAMIRKGENADGCINLEPSGGKLLTSIRGAVWFRLTLFGKSGHSGQAGQTRSALLCARDAIGILENYHADLLKQSRGIELFDSYPNPMPITFGRLEAGNWPASVPNLAVLEGVLGFLPNKTKEQICNEIRQTLTEGSDVFTDDNFNLEFTYRHDCNVVSPEHQLPQALLQAGQRCGLNIEIDAMTASCDAWFYNNQLGIPTVVYGPGSLVAAHSRSEQIAIKEIAQVSQVLTNFLLNYCG